jgi:hypothetical protein
MRKATKQCLMSRGLHGNKDFMPYRGGGGAPPLVAKSLFRSNISGISLDDIIYYGVSDRSAPLHIDLIKADGDGPEIGWMNTLVGMLREFPGLTIDAIALEVQIRKIDPTAGRQFAHLFRAFARHGFDFYRLDTNDFRRLITSRGLDAFSPAGTIGSLGRVRGVLSRDALEEEIFGLRAMRHLWRIRSNLTLEEWEVVLAPLHPRFTTHELLLVHRRVPLIEPRFGWGGLSRASPEAQAASGVAELLRGQSTWARANQGGCLSIFPRRIQAKSYSCR